MGKSEKADFDSFELEQLLTHIRQGKRNAVAGRQLALLMDISDRKIRDLVEEARRKGSLIINDQDGAGYYLAETADEVERQYKQMTSRAMAIMKSRVPFRKFLKGIGRQV